jgi:hypothetical protein
MEMGKKKIVFRVLEQSGLLRKVHARWAIAGFKRIEALLF